MTELTAGIPSDAPPRSLSAARLAGAVLKRGFDIAASLAGLLLLALPFLIVARWIRREGPGPIFYRGPRAGRGGKDFGILKFRTMREEPASYAGAPVTAQDDPRVTPLGRWLRDTKINELPQLWNVLVGEMSLVGPRPEDPSLAARWPEDARAEILSVRPGITSPASILYRDEESLLSAGSVLDDYLHKVMPDKLRLDRLYVRHHGFLSDLDTIFWTLAVLLPRLRRHPIPLESLFNGVVHRFMRRYFSWFLVDSLVALGAVTLAGLLWRLGGPLQVGMRQAVWMALGIALLFSLVNSARGLGRISWRYAKMMYVYDLALSSAISTALLLGMDWLWGGQRLAVGMVLVAGLLAFLGFAGVRYRERLLTGLGRRWLASRQPARRVGERVLVVGAGECGLLATWLLRRSRLSSAFSVVGMVDDDPGKVGMTIDHHPVLGFTPRIPEIVAREDVGVILFAIERIPPEEQARILALCRQTPARVVAVPDLMTLLRDRLSQGFEEAS